MDRWDGIGGTKMRKGRVVRLGTQVCIEVLNSTVHSLSHLSR